MRTIPNFHGRTSLLTAHQIEILARIDRGETPPEIAASLGVTEPAIYNTIARIRSKGARLSEVGVR